jgi:hypothetical protein
MASDEAIKANSMKTQLLIARLRFERWPGPALAFRWCGPSWFSSAEEKKGSSTAAVLR